MKIDNIIYLDDREPQIVAEVICIDCKKRWINIRPMKMFTVDLECKYCNKKGYVLETGALIDDETFERCEKIYPKLDLYRDKKLIFKYD